MAPAPTMWPSAVPDSSHVRPKVSTISSCDVPRDSPLPWIDMVQIMRMFENIMMKALAGEKAGMGMAIARSVEAASRDDGSIATTGEVRSDELVASGAAGRATGVATKASAAATMSKKAMQRLIVLSALFAVASAFTAGPAMRPSASHAVAARQITAPNMVVEPATVDAASSLIAASALSLPIPAYSPAKAFIMIFSNLLVISTMSIQGKGLTRGTSHDEMVETFGLTWLLSGTAFGHIVGAGAILGCSAAGFF